MKKSFFLLVTFVIICLIVIKFVDFNGGIILGEPDEFVHTKLVQSLLQTGKPIFQGKGFYYDMPGYFFLGAIFSEIFSTNPIVSLRLISFFSTVATAGLIFFYLQRKDCRATAILGGLFYLLTPLAVFYSRIGIIEPLLVFFLTGAMVFFDLGLQRRDWRLSVLSGIFLGLSFLTKYSILPIFFLMVLYFLFDVLRDNSTFWRSEFIKLRLTSFSPLIGGLLLFLPVFFHFYGIDSSTLKDQTRQIMGLTGEVKTELRVERLNDFFWWFSMPIIFLSILGFIISLKNFRRDAFVIFSLLTMVLAVVTRLPFYSRYALVLAPLLVIMAARGGLAFGRIRLWWAVLILVFVLNLNPVYEAWRVSHSDFLETAVQKALTIKPQARWLFSNFWPNILASIGGVSNYSWLTVESPDLQAFAPKENRDALEILKQEGGVVVLEDIYVKYFLTSKKGRDVAIEQLEKNYSPAFILENRETNFPNLRLKGDNLKVYIF